MSEKLLLGYINYTFIVIYLPQLVYQKISYIPKLDLPNLTDLFLHNNSIKKIEGLNGCLRLKKIHLYGNYIQDICGLSNLGLLKELWLQNNSISRISGVSCLSNLRCFYLAGNQVKKSKLIYIVLTSVCSQTFSNLL